jgi:hypothetical protein
VRFEDRHRSQVAWHTFERCFARQHRKNAIVRAQPFLARKLQLGKCVAPFRDRVGANEKDDDIGIVDGSFDFLVKAFDQVEDRRDRERPRDDVVGAKKL